MQIEKAIEILKELVDAETALAIADDVDAVKLGIEALKWRLEAEEKRWLGYLKPLPGETKD